MYLFLIQTGGYLLSLLIYISRARKDIKLYFLKVAKIKLDNSFESTHISKKMKPTVAADEMFPEGVGPYMDLEEAGGPSNLLMDLAANEKAVHGDFFNDFEDLFDDDDLK
ncbi:COP9 signalosome complex subunit 9 [Zerene cesonia]|uniref:COP9 signalosome complex subunit 9 n=2 Tax=Coliadinae TaxID=42450 RepID=UPI0018E4DE80|nr:COP9 signalosome complex subunit 9 [Zerene cesonia]